MHRFFAALCLSASTVGASAQVATIEFDGTFITGAVPRSWGYAEDGFNLASVPPEFSPGTSTYGGAWRPASGSITSDGQGYGFRNPFSTFSVSHGGSLFRFLGLDAWAHTFDYCSVGGGTGAGENISVSGSLGGVSKFATTLHASSCSAFTTELNAFSGTAIDNLLISVQALEYVTVDNLLVTTAVPEPASWLLMGCGLAGALGWSRQRARQARDSLSS
jgi:PEP-CTERM motif